MININDKKITISCIIASIFCILIIKVIESDISFPSSPIIKEDYQKFADYGPNCEILKTEEIKYVDEYQTEQTLYKRTIIYYSLDKGVALFNENFKSKNLIAFILVIIAISIYFLLYKTDDEIKLIFNKINIKKPNQLNNQLPKNYISKIKTLPVKFLFILTLLILIPIALIYYYFVLEKKAINYIPLSFFESLYLSVGKTMFIFGCISFVFLVIGFLFSKKE